MYSFNNLLDINLLLVALHLIIFIHLGNIIMKIRSENFGDIKLDSKLQ